MARPGPSRRCCVEKVWWPLASGAVCGHQWCRQRTRSPADQPGHSVRLVLTNHSPVSSGSIPGLTSPGRCHTLTFCPDTDVDTGDPSPAQPPVISGDGSYAPGCKLQYARTAHYEVYRLQHWISLTTLLLEKRVLLRMVILRPIVMGWENDGTVCSHYWPISIFISAVHTQAGSIYITWLPPPCLQYSPIPLTLPLHTCSPLSSGQCLNQCLMSNINFGRNSATGISCLNSTREIFQ